MTDKQMAAAATAFAARWKGRGYEKGDSQLFWTELLTEVFGIENPSTFIRYEEQVKIDKTMTESQCVAELFKMYQKLTQEGVANT